MSMSKVTLQVETKAGLQSVVATVTPGSPGLAISDERISLPSDDPKYSILHIASGMHVAATKTKRRAIAIVKAIAPLTDWTRPASEVALTKGLCRQVREIVFATG